MIVLELIGTLLAVGMFSAVIYLVGKQDGIHKTRLHFVDVLEQSVDKMVFISKEQSVGAGVAIKYIVDKLKENKI
jgi:hypothetical protein